MNKLFIKTALILSVAAGTISSCRNLDEIEKKMSSIESRVTALETSVNALNNNVKAIESLMKAGTINKVSEKDGVYTITLSNGETLTLNQGSVGVANAPVMSVDADGYWMVDYNDGKGKVFVMNGTNKVKATGTDGITPKFGVDASGYWTLSYDNGTTFEQVKDNAGKPVRALPSGDISDPYFKAVSYDSTSGIFKLVLKDGTELTLPVVPDFMCSIEGAGTTQEFAFQETRNFNVTLKGVSSTVITAPLGWNAVLADNILSVKAPAATKADVANTKEDVSILAISAAGYAAIAKVKVRLSGAPAIANPKAALTLGEVTETAITFNVALSDADGWKYIVKKSGEAAPSQEVLNTSGKEGTGVSATESGLAEATDYVIYVLPFKAGTLGAVATLSATTKTPVINDYYDAYNSGKDIVIAGVTYNKATNGEPILLKADAADTDLKASIHQKKGVFFLEQTGAGIFDIASIAEITKTVVIIGRKPGAPVTIKPSANMKLRSGSFVMKNVVFDMEKVVGPSPAPTYAFNNSSATDNLARFHFEECDFINITKPVLYANLATYGIKSIRIEHCRFQSKSAANVQLFNLYKSTVMDVYKEILFSDNVVYNASCGQAQVINYAQATPQTGTTWELDMTVENNIFYNVPSANGYFKFYQVKSLKMNNNIFWADPAGATASYGFILYSKGQAASAVTIGSNIAYGLKEGTNWSIAHSSSKAIPGSNILVKLSASPFETFNSSNGTYTLKTEHAAFGPRK